MIRRADGVLTFNTAFAREIFATDFNSEGTISNLGKKISSYDWCSMIFFFFHFLYESSGRVFLW